MFSDFKMFAKLSVRARLWGYLMLCIAVVITIPFKAIFNSVSIALLGLWWLMFMPKTFLNGRAVAVISVPFWLSVFGMFYTGNQDEGWFRVQQKSVLLILPATLLFSRVGKRLVLEVLATIFVLGIFLADAYSILVGIEIWVRLGDTSFLTSHGLVEKIDLYTYILALSGLIAQLFLMESLAGRMRLNGIIGRKVVSMALMIFFIVMNFLLAVQQIVFIWILLAGYYSFWMTKNPVRLALVMVGVLLVGLIGVSSVPQLRAKFLTPISNYSNNNIPLDDSGPYEENWNGIAVRKAIWTCAWDVVEANFLIGVGTGDGQDKLQESYANRKFYLAALYNRFNAHNQFLQVLVNSGFIGLLIWFLSLGAGLVRVRRSELGSLLVVSLLLAMMTESMLETNKGNLIYSFAFSIAFLSLSTHQKKMQ